MFIKLVYGSGMTSNHILLKGKKNDYGFFLTDKPQCEYGFIFIVPLDTYYHRGTGRGTNKSSQWVFHLGRKINLLSS